MVPASPEKTYTTEVREAKGPFPRFPFPLSQSMAATGLNPALQSAHPPPSKSNRHSLAASQGFITQRGEEGPLCLWKLHTVSQFGVISPSLNHLSPHIQKTTHLSAAASQWGWIPRGNQQKQKSTSVWSKRIKEGQMLKSKNNTILSGAAGRGHYNGKVRTDWQLGKSDSLSPPLYLQQGDGPASLTPFNLYSTKDFQFDQIPLLFYFGILASLYFTFQSL